MYFKKFSLILLALLIVTLAGCKKDDNPVAPSENDLVGTWVLTQIYLTSLGNMPVNPAEYGISGSFVLRSDKTFTVTFTFPDSEGPEVETGTWSAANGKITLKSSMGESDELPYTLSGNKLNVETIIELPVLGEQPAKLEFTKQ